MKNEDITEIFIMQSQAVLHSLSQLSIILTLTNSGAIIGILFTITCSNVTALSHRHVILLKIALFMFFIALSLLIYFLSRDFSKDLNKYLQRSELYYHGKIKNFIKSFKESGVKNLTIPKRMFYSSPVFSGIGAILVLWVVVFT